LAPYELQKYRAFRLESARESYLAAHVLVRKAAALVAGVGPGQLMLSQRCDECGGPHGRPVIVGREDLHVSMTHSDATVAAVAGPSRNAVDVESWDKLGADDLMRAHVFTDQEIAALSQLDGHPAAGARVDAKALGAIRLWVRKECLIKLGRLSLDSMATSDVRGEGLEVAPGAGISRSNYKDLLFSEWVHVGQRTSGTVASREPAEVIFLD
jgi:4'-phosphopantetheinyl transferase